MADLITRLAKVSSQAFERILHAPLALAEFLMLILASAYWGVGMAALAFVMLFALSGSLALGCYGGVLWGVASFFWVLLKALHGRYAA